MSTVFALILTDEFVQQTINVMKIKIVVTLSYGKTLPCKPFHHVKVVTH